MNRKLLRYAAILPLLTILLSVAPGNATIRRMFSGQRSVVRTRAAWPKDSRLRPNGMCRRVRT